MADIKRLPCELFGLVLKQLLQWPDIIQTSQVCYDWRVMVFQDPAFWKDIYIDKLDCRSLNWTGQRLLAGRDKAFSLEIVLTDVTPSMERPFQEILLPMLSGSLYRLRGLAITVDEIFILQLWEALCSFPSPLLESFGLRLTATPYPALNRLLSLPPNVFANYAPLLRDILICDVILPSVPIVAFRNVERVEILYHVYTTQQFPEHLFRYFEHMRHLRLAGNLVVFPKSFDSQTLAVVQRLQVLDIQFRQAVQLQFLERLPLQALDSIVVSYPNEDVVYAALSGLISPFRMSITRPRMKNEFDLEIRSGNGKHRRFVELLSNYREKISSNAIFDNVYFHCQMDGLHIATSLWPIMRLLLHPMPHLLTLALDIDEVDPSTRLATLPESGFEFRLPALKTLKLQTYDAPGLITTHDLTRFKTLLSDTPDIVVQLDGLVIAN